MTRVVPLGDDHHEQAVRLGRLSFGGDLGAAVPPPDGLPGLDVALAGPPPVLLDSF